ncbi:hypothetical protein UlMin_036520 [Ulmus minor]
MAVAVEGALPIFLDTIFPVWIALFISIIFVLVFAEIIPQVVCSRYELSVGAKLFVLMLDLILGKEHYVLLKRAELKTLIALHANEARKGGELSHLETSIISDAFDLTRKTAEDAMTPISNTFSLDINSKLNVQTMGLILSKGHSQIPIYSRDPKNIIGLILVKNFIFCYLEDESPIKQITLRTMPRYGKNSLSQLDYDYLPLYDILTQFLKSHCHMAIVLKSRGIQCIENNAAGIDPNQSTGILLLQNYILTHCIEFSPSDQESALAFPCKSGSHRPLLTDTIPASKTNCSAPQIMHQSCAYLQSLQHKQIS